MNLYILMYIFIEQGSRIRYTIAQVNILNNAALFKDSIDTRVSIFVVNNIVFNAFITDLDLQLKNRTNYTELPRL